MRGLATGAEDYEKFPKILKKNFVMLNVYCRSVAEEHDPRGPEGPYQFKDRSVPVIVFKKWDGETLAQHLGFGGGTRRLAQWVESALKKNGRVAAPKALKPLNKAFAKGEEHLAKDKPGYAFKEFQKAVTGGADRKKFPDGPPTITEQAKRRIDEILARAEEEIAEAEPIADGHTEDARKAYRKLLKRYGAIPDLKKRLTAALKALPAAE